MRRLNFFKTIFFISICACCVDPFHTSLSGNKILVVDGLVTDQPGPQTVTLSYSSNVGIGQFTRELISGAGVVLIDNAGVQTVLYEVTAGVYQTDSAFKAESGKSYFVRVYIQNEIYESTVESLEPVGQLDSIFFRLKTTPTVNQFEVYANTTRPEQSSGMMRWRSSFIYQIQTQPYLATEPLACAIPCTCCTCWVSGQNNEVVISDGSDFINDTYREHLVATIPIGDQQFEFKYYLTVEQLSISLTAYNFWNLVISQQKGTGSLFQPASANIQGNIHSTTKPNEQVLGLFQVSSISHKSIFINRNDIPANLQPAMPVSLADCRNQGTTTRPPFW